MGEEQEDPESSGRRRQKGRDSSSPVSHDFETQTREMKKKQVIIICHYRCIHAFCPLNSSLSTANTRHVTPFLALSSSSVFQPFCLFAVQSVIEEKGKGGSDRLRGEKESLRGCLRKLSAN